MWNIEALTGYRPKTTFWDDFTIAEAFGNDAIRDTFSRAFLDWRKEYIYLTELVMVLNWKMWQWYERDEERSMLYQDLWEAADTYAAGYLTGSELQYYYQTTD
jgi:hypothetical protein